MSAPAPLPPNEPERLAALRSLDALDTAPEAAFDAIVADAASYFDVPIALVSLVDEHRQWFKAEVGLGASETTREVAFCAHAILGDAVFVVEDALADPRFADNPLVAGAPNIRFYAGAPLIYGEGVRLGTLCVIDSRPRAFSTENQAALTELADRVVGEFWARRPGLTEPGP